MLTIRAYKDSDKEQLEYICIATADKNQTNTVKKREKLLWEYNRYYTRCCKETIFVVDDNGKAVGYVLCDINYKKFLHEFKKVEFYELKKINFFNAIAFYLSLKGQKPYAKNHSAHLHIDILEEYQRQGLGHKLINALKDKLQELNVNGVFLSVGANNEKGVFFYHKYGFNTIYKGKGFEILGIVL